MASMEVSGKKPTEITQHCDPCTEGDENIPAEAYCPVCNEHLCTTCATVHRRSRLSKSHKLVDKASMHKGSDQSQVRLSEYCKDHPLELVKYYCPTHLDLLCDDCIVKKDHTCKMEVIADVSMENENSTKFKQHSVKLKKITDEIFKTEHDIDSMAVSVEDSKNISVKQVRKFQAELIATINAMSDEITTEIESKTQTTHALLSNLKSTSKTGQLEAKHMTSVIEKCKGSSILLFIATHQTEAMATNVSNKVDDVKTAHDSIPLYSFAENTKTKTLLQNSETIGLYKQALKHSADHTNEHGKCTCNST